MSFNPLDHEPIQKRTSAFSMIKFWFPPDLRQIIEYQANFYPKRLGFFYISSAIQKQNKPRNQIEKILFLHRDRLSDPIGTAIAPENASLDAAQHIRSYPHWPLHEDSFSGPDALIGTVWIESHASEAGADFAADPPGLHGLTCPRAFAHQILVRRYSPIQQWNRENFSYALIIVRQSVSETLSPWYGQSNKSFFSPWNLTGIHTPNTMTIMYGPYRHRRHVGAFAHPILTSKIVPGFYAILYTFYTLRGKVRRPPDLHQWTLPRH